MAQEGWRLIAVVPDIRIQSQKPSMSIAALVWGGLEGVLLIWERVERVAPSHPLE